MGKSARGLAQSKALRADFGGGGDPVVGNGGFDEAEAEKGFDGGIEFFWGEMFGELDAEVFFGDAFQFADEISDHEVFADAVDEFRFGVAGDGHNAEFRVIEWRVSGGVRGW